MPSVRCGAGWTPTCTRASRSRTQLGAPPRSAGTGARGSPRSTRSGGLTGQESEMTSMTGLPHRVSLREVGPRDGLQNEDPVPTDGKVELIDALSKTGLRRIEAVSFVHPKAIPQMADADEVWERIDRNPDVRYSALVPNIRGAQRALAAGFAELEVVISASDTHNRR